MNGRFRFCCFAGRAGSRMDAPQEWLISSLLRSSAAKIFIATWNERRGRVIPMHTAKPYNFLIARVKPPEDIRSYSDNWVISDVNAGTVTLASDHFWD